MKVIVLNLKNMAVTEYEHFDFLGGMCRFNGKYYGADGEGIHLLEGETDNGVPIEAEIKTGIDDAGTSLLKRLAAIYCALKADGPYAVGTVSDNNDEHEYAVTDDPHKTAMHTRKVAPAKGIKKSKSYRILSMALS